MKAATAPYYVIENFPVNPEEKETFEAMIEVELQVTFCIALCFTLGGTGGVDSGKCLRCRKQGKISSKLGGKGNVSIRN